LVTNSFIAIFFEHHSSKFNTYLSPTIILILILLTGDGTIILILILVTGDGKVAMGGLDGGDCKVVMVWCILYCVQLVVNLNYDT
jgi:hypothetical protein